MAKKTKSIADAMADAKVESENKDLNEILKRTEAQTESELQEAGQRSKYLGEYMTLNKELAGKIDGFLTENQTFSEKFKAMIAEKDVSTAGRFFKALPLVGGLVGDKLDPKNVAEVINDMYRNMILQKDAVKKQLGIIESRQDSLFEASAQTVVDYRTAATKFQETLKEHRGLEKSLELAKTLRDSNGTVEEGTSLSALEQYFPELGVTEEQPEFIDLLEVTSLVEKLERQESEVGKEYTQWEIELNAAKSAIKGYEVQKKQFGQYVETTSVLLFGLETHLKYSKELVENQAILAQAQGTAINAMKAYNNYQEAVNETFKLNSIGVQLMARETADMLSRDMFDEDALTEAEDRVDEAKTYWKGFRSEYTNKAEKLAEDIGKAVKGK